MLTASIQFSLDHRPEAVQHALQYARDMGRDLADKFVGMYVNHWTLDYGERGRESIRRFLGQGFRARPAPAPAGTGIRHLTGLQNDFAGLQQRHDSGNKIYPLQG